MAWHGHETLTRSATKASQTAGLSLVLRQPALGFNRGLAAHTGSCNSLTVNVICAIAGDVNTWYAGFHLGAVDRLEIASGVDIQYAGERLRIGEVPDRNEHAFDVDHAFGSGRDVPRAQAAYRAFGDADDFDRNGVPDTL